MLQNRDSIAAAMDVLDRFMSAFSAADENAIRATFNFPHVRFHDSKVTVYPTAADYNLGLFRSTRDAAEWARSLWTDRKIIHTGDDKVHVDTEFSRLRADGSVIATYRSIYIVTRIDGRWGIQGRSSFAP
jgi:hypothetical protein